LEGKSRAVRDFLSEVNVGYLQITKNEKTEIAFANINSPSDLPKINLKSSLVLNRMNRM
jgi:molybdopterin-guanine dinucleotide biosynthesis protein A